MLAWLPERLAVQIRPGDGGFPNLSPGGLSAVDSAKQLAEQSLPTHIDILGTLCAAVKQKNNVLARDSEVNARK